MTINHAPHKHLWIVGLRRSGTTAIWRMFRGLDGFICYDEPLNPELETYLPAQHRKGTWDEFIDLWNTDHAEFTEKLTSIDPTEEVTPQINPSALEFLSYLAKRPTIVDFTRLNFKMGDVMTHFPDVVTLFLYRSPIAFATSHLINSENRKFLRQRYYRNMFFSKSIGFDSWSLQKNFNAPGFVEQMETCAIKPKKPLGKLKSVEKLLLFWLTARRLGQKATNSAETGRAFAASYEDIIDGRSEELENAIEAVGIDLTRLQRDHLRGYSLGHRHKDPVWVDLARNAGFSENEVQIYLRRNTQ